MAVYCRESARPKTRICEDCGQEAPLCSLVIVHDMDRLAPNGTVNLLFSRAVCRSCAKASGQWTDDSLAALDAMDAQP